ncbi:MAG TPA: energy transducer TonB [Terracidiphilus sp.]|nr:energy transducer TonB [Terracidiphilus sp.]
MGNLVNRDLRPASGGRQSEDHRKIARPEAIGYNPTSLAVEEARDSQRSSHATSYEERLPPRLVPKRSAAADGAPNSALWKGLDPLADRRNGSSGYVSLILHVMGISAVLWWSLTAHPRAVQEATTVTPLDFALYAPPNPPLLKVAKPKHGGGGGGEHRIIDPSRGRQPRFARVPLAPPQIQQVAKPPIPVQPAIDVRLPMENKLPSLGVAQSPQVAMESQGSGEANGFGIGIGGGMGAGKGDGAGPGSGGSYGGGIMSVGGGVSAPQVIYSVDPEFTAQARQGDYQGTVAIQLVVDSEGRPQDIHIVRHLGMGLDQKAIEAVRQYRFRPAMYEGHPVAVQMIIEVAFHLH